MLGTVGMILLGVGAVGATGITVYGTKKAVQMNKEIEKIREYLKKETNGMPLIVSDLLQTTKDDWDFDEDGDFILQKELFPKRSVYIDKDSDLIRMLFSASTSRFNPIEYDPICVDVFNEYISLDREKIPFTFSKERLVESIEGVNAYMKVLREQKMEEKKREKRGKLGEEKEILEKELEHILSSSDALASFQRSPYYHIEIIGAENHYYIKLYERKKEYSYYIVQMEADTLKIQKTNLGRAGTASLYDKHRKRIDQMIQQLVEKRKKEQEELVDLFANSLRQTRLES